jgi:hypothetical protein
MSNDLPKCPRCNGSKWVKGLVGGIYECPDCWAHEQNQLELKKSVCIQSHKPRRGRPPKSEGFNHGQED